MDTLARYLSQLAGGGVGSIAVILCLWPREIFGLPFSFEVDSLQSIFIQKQDKRTALPPVQGSPRAAPQTLPSRPAVEYISPLVVSDRAFKLQQSPPTGTMDPLHPEA